MTDLKITEIVAKWMGYKKGRKLGFTHAEGEMFFYKLEHTPDTWEMIPRFCPLHDWNDTMKVVERLPDTRIIWDSPGTVMLIRWPFEEDKDTIIFRGNLSGLQRAICELVVELVKE